MGAVQAIKRSRTFVWLARWELGVKPRSDVNYLGSCRSYFDQVLFLSLLSERCHIRPHVTHGLRRGLHSFAASRLISE